MNTQTHITLFSAGALCAGPASALLLL